MGNDRAEVQCIDAAKGFYRLVSPDVFPERIFRSEKRGGSGLPVSAQTGGREDG